MATMQRWRLCKDGDKDGDYKDGDYTKMATMATKMATMQRWRLCKDGDYTYKDGDTRDHTKMATMHRWRLCKDGD